MSARVLVLAAVMLAAAPAVGSAQTVLPPVRGADGVWYAVVLVNGVNYAQAAGLADRLGGELAVPSSAGVLGQLTRAYGGNMFNIWLGGFRNPNNVNQWIDFDGRPIRHLPFAPGEPNNFRGREIVLNTANVGGQVRYNDLSPNGTQSGFLIRYN